MKVKIFTEGGPTIGVGHISRCSALYEEVISRGYECEFLIQGNVQEIAFLKDKNFDIIQWRNREFLRTKLKKSDFCIVDSYLASVSLHKVIVDNSKRCLFIDDNNRISYPKGIIVNPSLNPSRLEYSMSDDNIYLLGKDYIILRKAFLDGRRDHLERNVKNVLITMGGSKQSILEQIVVTLSVKYPKIKFHVVLAAKQDSFRNVYRNSSNIECHFNISAEMMSRSILQSDLVITAAGQTIYELMATNTPFIPIQVADNQKNNVQGLVQMYPQLAILKSDDQFLLKRLEQEVDFMMEYTNRQNFIKVYANQVDGLGCKRIIDFLLAE